VAKAPKAAPKAKAAVEAKDDTAEETK